MRHIVHVVPPRCEIDPDDTSAAVTHTGHLCLVSADADPVEIDENNILAKSLMGDNATALFYYPRKFGVWGCLLYS